MRSFFRGFFCFLVVLPLSMAHAQGVRTPALSFAGYVGGINREAIRAVAVAQDGGIWVAGSSSSLIEFPAYNFPIQANIAGGTDIFLAKYQLNADGTATCVYWTWIGGTGNEDVAAMALDQLGRVYLTGPTTSTDFPMGGYAFQTASGGATDAYILIVDPNIGGTDGLVFSSYYGGTVDEWPTALAVDPTGAVVVVGYSSSTDLPNVTGHVQEYNRGAWDVFIIRVDPSLSSSLTYASYFGGGSTDVATGVALDQNGNVWMTGYTASNDFPTANAPWWGWLQTPADGFLVELDLTQSGLDALVYGTFFGGGSLDVPQKMAIDESGNIWVAGYTLSDDFPVTGDAFQRYFGGVTDGFLMRFDMTRPPDQIIAYSTYLGGSGGDVLYDFKLLGGGKVAVCGYTMSNDFPVAGSPIQAKAKSALPDVFVSRLNTNLSGAAALEFSTYYGGTSTDVASSIAVDAKGNLVFGGYTNSGDLPVTDGSVVPNTAPVYTGFLARIGN